MAACRFYMSWLVSVGLTQALGHRTVLEAPLTAKGKSVMMMLQATRDPDWVSLPMAEVIDSVACAFQDPDENAREEALTAFERSVGLRRSVFARERVGTTFMITLTGIAADTRMPTRRVVWSQSFGDRRTRDDFFAWIAVRVDRWDDWGQLAYRKGGEALTRRMLALVIAERTPAS